MRKGTRACQECRRRKLKCTFADDTSLTCFDCIKTGTVCSPQTIVTKTGVNSSGREQRVRKRSVQVARPASVAKRIVRLASSSTSRTNTANNVNEGGHNSLPPIYGVFKSEVLTARHELGLPLSVSHNVTLPANGCSVHDHLLSTISQEPNVLSVLTISSSWYTPFRNHYANLDHPVLCSDLALFVKQNLTSPHPVNIALGLMGIATSLQTMRAGIDDEKLFLSTNSLELMQRITAIVDQTVLYPHNEEINCREGVILLLMRSKHHAETNQLRKAWIYIQRAILASQAIDDYLSTDLLAWNAFVQGLCDTDLFFSMFLGLPCLEASGVERPVHPAGHILASAENIRHASAIVAGQINLRNTNHEDTSFEAIAMTLELDAQLSSAQCSTSPSWWKLRNGTASPEIFEDLYAQFWFWQTKCFLYLPYMLLADTNPSHVSKRATCLQASQELIETWLALRSSSIYASYLCTLDDFQALIATIIIQVGLLQQISGDDDDFAMLNVVRRVKDIFESLAKLQGGHIARQGLYVLCVLESAIMDSTSVQNLYGDSVSVTLLVPYLGAIAVQTPKRKYWDRTDTSQDISTTGSSTSSRVETNSAQHDNSSTSSRAEENEDNPLALEGYGRDLDFVDAPIDWDKFMYGDELSLDWNDDWNI